jgi:hypothetical protein
MTPVQFMSQYRNLRVNAAVDDPVARMTRVGTHTVQLRKYFMMDWSAGTEESRDYSAVTSGGSARNVWFQSNKERIRTAAMGKGAPHDYELALEWAVRSGKIPVVNAITLQSYADEHLGIDCSGFVTNYLAACGKLTYTTHLVRNTSASSYFNAARAVNSELDIRQGDLLVWMEGNGVKTSPGHVAVVESYVAQSAVGGSLRVVEATGAAGANPKLLDSMYAVEAIIPKGGAVQAMTLAVRRHGSTGSRVSVMRL